MSKKVVFTFYSSKCGIYSTMMENKISSISFKASGTSVKPLLTISSDKFKNFLQFVDKKVGSHDQRLILGLTALCTQPFIDITNKRVDQETRNISTIRTVAKIIAGTTVGVLVRWGAFKLVKTHKAFKIPGIDTASLEFKKYSNAFGTLIGTLAGLITNFAIDAPLTKFLTNAFSSFVKRGDK